MYNIYSILSTSRNRDIDYLQRCVDADDQRYPLHSWPLHKSEVVGANFLKKYLCSNHENRLSNESLIVMAEKVESESENVAENEYSTEIG